MQFTLHFPQALSAFAWPALWRTVRAGPECDAEPMRQANAPVHALTKDSTLTLQRPQGARVECLKGQLWITLDHDMRDIILEAGQSYCADHQSRMLIHALAASNLRIDVALRH
jgi:Protein of unknown function (DUF2917)